MFMRRAKLLLLLVSIGLLSGCWDVREMPQLAIVSSMGIDKSPAGNQYRVSFQVINPSEISAGITEGTGGRTTPITVYAGSGDTLFEAIRESSDLMPRQLFFSHTRIIVIGEQLAREGIEDIFDMFERFSETRLTSRVLIARGSSAEAVLSTLTPIERIPSNSINGKLKFTSKLLSENMEIQIDDVIRALSSTATEPVLNGVRLVGDINQGNKKRNVESTIPIVRSRISGIAMFKSGKLVRWLDGTDARGVVRIQNKMKSSVDMLPCMAEKNAIAIELLRANTKVKAAFHNGKPSFHISVKQEGSLNEVKCSINLQKPEEITKLESQWSELVKQEIKGAFSAAQKEKSDIFGLGETFNRQHPSQWKKINKEWSSLFAESEVNVTVDSFIRHSGMRIKPSFPEQ
ncbi:Ger(x)C family spore germination protein [Paenibacillus sp. MMS18-CY102]|uniref:Ger(x)C family spore germination protein n=1 Tax=Paenibacillus sp. MMS18-CY102 TaxID=2682849 RepID=UPI0013658479|nr:Ger(x)C family spore germination protein [Paenibacillus sp. MMS18-CY102]MWC31296.1 Ger(x)C family spore germination protein [Paenibacillus sp. MMS18-CY102]